MNSDKK